jgi:8-amino-7-oxononanoate synthase
MCPRVTYLERVGEMLGEIRAEGRYRKLYTHAPDGSTIDFSSNDYLGLSKHSQVVQAFRHATRVGAGGARLLGGRHREHSLLEEELATWLGRERALLFSSGYHAALGAIPVLARVTGAVYSDARNHASLIDGVRLTRCERRVYARGALPPRSKRVSPALVVTESIFGMDGDTVHPGEVLRDLRDDDVLFVDEAHALGVAGADGAGLARELDDPRVVVMGTLSKAFGAHGGFVAGPSAAIELLVNAARTFVFDSALPPAIALAARVALAILRRDEGRRARARLQENAERLRAGLGALGIHAGAAPSPIVPVLVGDEEPALALSAALAKRRFYVPAIRPPTVPPRTSRLRISVRADHTPEQIDLLVTGIAECIAT